MQYFLSLLTTVLVSIVFTSCRMDHPDPIPQEPTQTIRLNIAHEFEDVEEDNEPLLGIKGSSGDIYAVQVYRKSLVGFNSYAYGIFDDPSLMSIELETNSYYKIEMTVVPNGTTVIAKDEHGGYQEPFTIKGLGDGSSKITNEFIESKSVSMANISSGYAMVTQIDDIAIGYDIPPISRFYGISDEFKPTKDMAHTIYLKWVVFGLTVIPINFNEGSIEIKMEGAPILTIKPDEPNAINKKIFTFNHSYLETPEWCDNEYSEKIPTTITWIKSDGSHIVLHQPLDPIKIKRRTNKILRIQCGENNINSIVISKESQDLIDDDYIFPSKKS